ncbi:MAG: EscU/YscU/HrcU family type III secretion system export apparatus switch protein, partial [Myxococcales bacterium]|nr:EscU/YscU/HrcU family type III secretion system export apparatus switch protein [Myxococcales bacterium]
MAENENGAERTELPTPQRRERARKEGQVAQSQEVGIAGSMLVLCAFVILLAPWIGEVAVASFARGMNLEAGPTLDVARATEAVRLAMWAALALVAPAAFSSLITGVSLGVAQVGFQPNFDVLAPKWSRLDPQNWLKKVFSPDFFVTLGRNLLKGVGLVSLAVWVLREVPHRLDRLVFVSPLGVISTLHELAIKVAGPVTFAVVIIALIDLLYTRFRHEQRLMMTKQEVKDELKETEGNPQIKAAMRKRALDYSNDSSSKR